MQLISMPLVSFTKNAMDILNMVDPDPDVDVLLNSGVEATDVNSCAHIPVTARHDLELVTMVLGWTRGVLLEGFSGATCRIA